MKIIDINGKQFKVIDTWLDLSVDKYIQIVKLYNNLENIIEEEFLVKFIQIISNIDESFISNLYEDDLIFFTDLMANFKLQEIKPEKATHFIFNDKLYSYNDIGKLTLGEKISLKLLEKNNKSEHDTWLNILSIMIRPSKKIINQFNEEVFEIEPFNGDINIINKRKQLVKDIPAVNALHIIQSFTIGRE